MDAIILNLYGVVTLIILLVVLFVIYRKKIIVKFLRNENGVYKVIGTKSLKTNAEQIRYKNKTFHINPDKICYLETGKLFSTVFPVILIDYDKGNTLTLKDIKSRMDGEELDVFIGKKIIRQLTENLLFEKYDLIMWIVFFALGFLLGIFVYPYLPQPQPQGGM